MVKYIPVWIIFKFSLSKFINFYGTSLSEWLVNDGKQ